MTRRPRTQLVLALDHGDRSRPTAHSPVTPTPEGLVQALADLLLEALGTHGAEMATGKEVHGEPEDHA